MYTRYIYSCALVMYMLYIYLNQKYIHKVFGSIPYLNISVGKVNAFREPLTAAFFKNRNIINVVQEIKQNIEQL